MASPDALPDEVLAMLNLNGEEAKKFRSEWKILPGTKVAVMARIRELYPFMVEAVVRHAGIQCFDYLNRIELFLWLLGDTDHDLYRELEGDRPNMKQLGAPYIHAFGEHLDLSRPEVAKSDVYVAMVRGMVCPWCAEGRDMGCVT